MDKIQTTKKVLGYASNLGTGLVVSTFFASYVARAANPLIKVVVWFGGLGLAYGAGKFAERSMEEMFDEYVELFASPSK